jgi:hypothetical protein
MRYIQDQIRQAREAKGFTRIERGGDLRLSTLLEMARILDLEPMLIPKRLVPAIQALIEHAASPDQSGLPAKSSPPLAGGEPEDAED